MYRRFGTVVCQDIHLGAPGEQDIQDAVEQPAEVTPGSADVWLRRGEVATDNLPGIIIDFLESHDPEHYLKDLIILGPPL